MLFLLLQIESFHANITEFRYAGNITLLYFIKIKLDLIPPLSGLWKNSLLLDFGGENGALHPWACVRAQEPKMMSESGENEEL